MTSPASPAPDDAAGFISRLGRFVFRFRDLLAPLVGVACLLFARPRPIFGSYRADHWMDALGLFVAALGQAIRVTVIGYAYIVRGGTNKQLAAPKLVCEGFYAHSRNPMYLGNFLLLTGLALIYNSPLLYFVALPACFAALLSIVRAEEEFLRARFGADYEDYCRRVNRFLPDPKGLRETLSTMRFDWRRVLRKEYGTTFAWTSTAVVFLAVERISSLGWAASGPQILHLAEIWVGIVVAYATVRWMKKTRRLVSPPPDATAA